MAIAYKRYPPDVVTDRAVGIKLPFNKVVYSRYEQDNYNLAPKRDVGMFVQSYTTEDQAISNLISLLLTRKGERAYHPELGSYIPDFVFEQNSKENQFTLEESIKLDIKNWLPYIYLNQVKVGYGLFDIFGAANENSVQISINFKVTEVGANRTVAIFLEEERLRAELIT